jgi:hypothetical protein
LQIMWCGAANLLREALIGAGAQTPAELVCCVRSPFCLKPKAFNPTSPSGAPVN